MMTIKELLEREHDFVFRFLQWVRRDPGCWTEAQLIREAQELFAASIAKPLPQSEIPHA